MEASIKATLNNRKGDLNVSLNTDQEIIMETAINMIKLSKRDTKLLSAILDTMIEELELIELKQDEGY